MRVEESHQSRHLLLTADRGEDLVIEIMKALDGCDARAGWIRGSGVVEDVLLAISPARAGGEETVRAFGGPAELLTVEGSIAHPGGSPVDLTVTLARETERGLDIVGGRLRAARAVSVQLFVTATSDAAAPRRPAANLSAPAPAPSEPERPTRSADGLPEPPPVVPIKRSVSDHDLEEPYPEPGDTVTHFHFGDCTVLESDGERIRFRQGEEGRVREVALSMLKIELASTNPATKARHFKLLRKN